METDTLTAPDTEEAAMRDLAHETDRNENRPVETEAPETPKTPETEPETPEQQQPETEQPDELQPAAETEQKEGRPRDPATGKFQKPDTEYSKAVKEQARIAKTWRNIQAEKEQFRAEQAQWQEQQRMQQLEAVRQQYAPLKKDGLTAQEYHQGALRFEQEGDYENAYKAHKVAQQMFQQEQGRAQQMQGVEAEYQWRTQLQQAYQMRPDIFDSDSTIGQHVQRIIDQNPWLYHIPQGFLRAAEVANMLVENAQLKEKDDELIELRAYKEQHQKKSQPAKGGFASPRLGEKDFDEMDLNEMESHLKGLTAEADNFR